MSGDLCYRMLPPILTHSGHSGHFSGSPLVVNISAGRVRALTHGSALSDGWLVREAGQHWSDHRGLIADTEIETGPAALHYTHLNSGGYLVISGNYMAHICMPQ